MEQIVADVAQEQVTMQHRAGDLRCEVTPGHVTVGGQYVRRLVAELVNNALKFSIAGTPVDTGTIESEMYRLCISDAGRGMDPDQVERQGAFVQFDRADQEQQGAGLGLATGPHDLRPVRRQLSHPQ